MRAFLALDVPNEVLERLGRLAEILAPHARRVKWVPPHQIHLTLKFFKDLPDRIREEMREPIGSIAGGTPPFTLRAIGAGAFGPPGRPRVVWCGVEDAGGRLGGFAAALEEALAGLGIAREARPFNPHLTLGRAKGGAERDLFDVLASRKEFDAGKFSADHLTLYESQLSASGPRYRVLETWPFLGRP